jgi:hypothetical protein
MKFVQAIYLITAVALSTIIIGVSCLQFSMPKVAIEFPFEEPVDEDAKDISDDFADDKEYTHHTYQYLFDFSCVLHSAGYLVSHANQVKEIYTPPPKFS